MFSAGFTDTDPYAETEILPELQQHCWSMELQLR
jgi:hypothetical protein